MLEAYKAEKADRLILLGDLLYHGPRNDLPKDYAPKEVIAMLNEHRDDLYVVRGNCDAEVDQMVLHFPIMADYCIIMDGERTIYASHGPVSYTHLDVYKRQLSTLGAFGLVFAMTGGGPAIMTTTLSIFMYQKAFIAYQIGYGMAIALFILAIGILLSLVYIRLIRANDGN